MCRKQSCWSVEIVCLRGRYRVDELFFYALVLRSLSLMKMKERKRKELKRFPLVRVLSPFWGSIIDRR
ncbi:hypothetical protein CSUI_007266 [Cystoisospora suis]|uniref:Uncharacterized protein n=1 Tax=Cystoisospora suis TaxID=483139 RepID=A0A2C6KMZ1_9APIC|nr:hypothetical protein CSUI_007266 [Cystoisospora suis]